VSIVGEKECLRCEGKGYDYELVITCPDCKGRGTTWRYACVGANCSAEGIWQPVIVVPIIGGGPHPIMLVQKNAVCDAHRLSYNLLDFAGTDWYEMVIGQAKAHTVLEFDPESKQMERMPRPMEVAPLERCWVTFRPCGWEPKPRPLFRTQTKFRG
jgi:hypothetical protein